MTNTTQSTYNLILSEEQFDSLYGIVADTIEYLDTEDCDLNDYEIHKVWQQMNNIKGVN